MALEAFGSFFADYTLRTVALGAGLLGIFAGALGCFAVLRKQSLLGDAMSHAALPGIVIAFMLTTTKEPFFLLLGAIISGWIGTVAMITIIKNTRIKEDAALGVILSVFFGFGLVLLTVAQRMPGANQSGLNSYLFGNAATLIQRDVTMMLVLGLMCLGVLALFWKEFKLLSFDPGFGKSIGMPNTVIDVGLTSLIVVAIVIGLQTVGVVLMSAMIIAPAVAARQWTHRLSTMVFLSALFGGAAGVIGAIISASIERMPTGPTIVVVISAIVLVSLLFAPGRGLIWEYRNHLHNKSRMDLITVLIILFRLSKSHRDPHYAHHVDSVRAAHSGNVNKSLHLLTKLSWVLVRGDRVQLTEKGLSEARRLTALYGGSNGTGN